MKIIAVTSGKGGTGKSCVAAYTGAALVERGKKVLLMELGGDTRSIDVIVGLSETSLFSAQDVIKGLCGLKQAACETQHNANLHLVPCSPDMLGPRVGAEGFSFLMRELKNNFDYDYVILDGADFSVIPPAAADMIINVLSPETLSVRAAAVLTRALLKAGAKEIRIIINNVPTQIVPMAGVSDFDDIIDMVGARLLAVIPSSPKLRYASNNMAALDDDSLTPKVFECVAARLEGENRPLLVR